MQHNRKPHHHHRKHSLGYTTNKEKHIKNSISVSYFLKLPFNCLKTISDEGKHARNDHSTEYKHISMHISILLMIWKRSSSNHIISFVGVEKAFKRRKFLGLRVVLGMALLRLMKIREKKQQLFTSFSLPSHTTKQEQKEKIKRK
ncbi:CLUMA_CG021572, isoform A [Clunio marinus]|uniref:CLUMA_CG021572, isoform A n=1 Tax=Clunio marinus TaxID=568069 RepID=A0A1J1J9D4_9DIPT|nr:CLUMA_CG021572, isoform A [Clunio marinus]